MDYMHFEAIEIDALHELYGRVLQSSPSGKLDQAAFESIFVPPLSVKLAQALFAAFDEHGSGAVDVDEFICGLSATCRGTIEDALRFCLSVRADDQDGDTQHTRAAMFSIVNSFVKLSEALRTVSGGTGLPPTRSSLSTADSAAEQEEAPIVRASSSPPIAVGCDEPEPEPDQEKISGEESPEEGEPDTPLRRTKTATAYQKLDGRQAVAMRLVEDSFDHFDIGEGGTIETDQVMAWLAESEMAQDFVKTIKRVTQTSIGVRPGLPEEEAEVVGELFGQLSFDAPGTVFIISQGWWARWCAYSGLSGPHASVPEDDSAWVKLSGSGRPAVGEDKEGAGPGAIDNGVASGLLDRTATAQVLRLRQDVVEGKDYKVLPRAVWATLHKWYGGGPVIQRQLVPRPVVDGEDAAASMMVEIHPLFVIIGTAGKGALPAWGRVTLQFSSSDTIEQVLNSVMTAFGDPPVAKPTEHITQRVRLWSCHTPTIPVLLEDPSMTLAQAKFVDGQYFELEDCLDSGEWSGESGRAARGTPVAVASDGPKTIGIPGIRNLGNTCYMNSALQCLSRTEPLRHYLLTQAHLDMLEGRQADLPVTASYTQLMRSMWSPDAASTGLCDTSVLQDFKRTIGKFNEQFAGYNQQDVSEFLAFLIDGLHEEMNGIRVKPWVEMDTDGKPLPELAQCAWDYYLSRERSVITDAFNGQMMSTLTCTVCQNQSTTFDPFSTLTIELPLPKTVPVEVELFWRRKPRTLYALMVPRECKVAQLREALAEEIGLAVECQKLVQLSWRGESFATTNISDERIVAAYDRVQVYEVRPLERVGCHFTVMHRRQEDRDGYFLNEKQTVLFGTPIICAVSNTDEPSEDEGEDEEEEEEEAGERDDSQLRWSTQSDLIRAIWDEVCCLINEKPSAWNAPGFDHTMYFTVKCVCAGGHKCWTCDWTRMCSGCVVAASDARANWAHFISSHPVQLVIDWRPDVVARFFDDAQWSRVVEDPSVARCRAEALSPTDLDECLRSFTKTETMDGDEMPYCSKCKEFCPTTKQLKLWRLPPILIVHLKRFAEDARGRMHKIQSLVNFPTEDLDLSEFVSPDCDLPLEKYDLFALSNHHGILGGGHYVAHGLFPETGQWYNFNGESRRPCLQAAPWSAVSESVCAPQTRPSRPCPPTSWSHRLRTSSSTGARTATRSSSRWSTGRPRMSPRRRKSSATRRGKRRRSLGGRSTGSQHEFDFAALLHT